MDEVREYAGANQSIGEMPRVEVLDSLTDTIEEHDYAFEMNKALERLPTPLAPVHNHVLKRIKDWNRTRISGATA